MKNYNYTIYIIKQLPARKFGSWINIQEIV